MNQHPVPHWQYLHELSWYALFYLEFVMKLKATGRICISFKNLIKFILVILMILLFGLFGKINLFIPRPKLTQPRGVITTLIRSTDQSVLLTINMIHSIIQFHSTSDKYFYPFIIFHDHNFTSSMRQQILSCTIKNKSQINISFALVDFHTSVQPANGSQIYKSIGYRLMCRFWSYDIFYHPAIVQGGYDYLMRMDDDSYFSDTTNKDLFLYMQTQQLDYIYRTTYIDSKRSIQLLFERFFHNESVFFDCIYNNFFIIRLKWYYNSKPVQRLVNELVRDDMMLREYIGDGCVHTAMLKVDERVRKESVVNISYGHNFHMMVSGDSDFIFNPVDSFSEEIKKACHQLTVLKPFKEQLIRINMS